MLGFTLGNGSEEHNGVDHPDDRQQDCQRQFQLCVFFARGVTHRQRDDRADDHRLPTPEGKRGERVGDQSRLAGALHDVVRGAKQCTATKGKDHKVGMQGAKTAEGRPFKAKVQFRPHKL